MSKGLEALEGIKNCCLSESIVDGSWVYIKDEYEDECEIIEQELKALELIKPYISIQMFDAMPLNEKLFVAKVLYGVTYPELEQDSKEEKFNAK